jgi:hypothetical protein
VFSLNESLGCESDMQTATVQSVATPPKLPASIQKMIEGHQTEIQKEMKKLGTSCCVNQYSIKK